MLPVPSQFPPVCQRSCAWKRPPKSHQRCGDGHTGTLHAAAVATFRSSSPPPRKFPQTVNFLRVCPILAFLVPC